MSKFASRIQNRVFLSFVSLIFIDYITRKLEEKIGLDLNGDGRIGGPGMTAKLERATHVDFNRDGVIGGYRPPHGGGKIIITIKLFYFIFHI
jgi:hypothetical protein